MPRELAAAAALTLLVSASAGAQQPTPTDPPPNPHEVVADQRLEVINEKLITAGNVLQEASDTPSRTDKAIEYGRGAVQAVRDALSTLPQDKRMPYEQAILRAEQALMTNDPAASAEAIASLREEVVRLVQTDG